MRSQSVLRSITMNKASGGDGIPVESESRSVMFNSLWPHGLYSPWNSPGQNTGVGNLSLLQAIFPTQGSNPGLLHCRRILYQLSHNGSPRILGCVAYPFSREMLWIHGSTQGLLHCRRILYQLRYQGIPVELLRILKDDMWKCCTQYPSKFGKLSSGHRTGKGQFSFQSQRKAMPKNVQTTAQLYSPHMLQSNAQNSPSQASTVCELRTSICSSWI